MTPSNNFSITLYNGAARPDHSEIWSAMPKSRRDWIFWDIASEHKKAALAQVFNLAGEICVWRDKHENILGCAYIVPISFGPGLRTGIYHFLTCAKLGQEKAVRMFACHMRQSQFYCLAALIPACMRPTLHLAWACGFKHRDILPLAIYNAKHNRTYDAYFLSRLTVNGKFVDEPEAKFVHTCEVRHAQ